MVVEHDKCFEKLSSGFFPSKANMPFYERFSAREKAWSTHLFPCLGFGRGLYQARRHQKQETRPCRSLQCSVTCLSSGKVFCCVKSVKVRIGEKYNCHTYPRVQTRSHYRCSIIIFQVTTTVLVLFSPVHTNTFTNKNALFDAFLFIVQTKTIEKSENADGDHSI